LTKRTRNDIYEEILDIAHEAVSAATISKEIGIPYNRIEEYISPLLKSKLLEQVEKDGKDVYQRTQKGYNFLTELKKIKELIDKYGL